MVKHVQHTSAHPQLRERMIQIVAHLTRELNDVDKTKVMKLVFLADRAAIQKIGHPISFDDFKVFRNGPAAADIEQGLFSRRPPKEWLDAFEFTGPTEMRVKDQAHPNDLLSDAELKVLDDILYHYGRLCRDDLVAISHSFPEWKAATRKGKKRLTHHDIMDGLKMSKAAQERVQYRILTMRGCAIAGAQ